MRVGEPASRVTDATSGRRCGQCVDSGRFALDAMVTGRTTMPKNAEPIPHLSAAERKRLAPMYAQRLADAYGDPRPALNYRDAYELLVAVILSAQTTDEGVNKATPALFARYPDPAALAGADQADVEVLVHSLGFFRQKAKNIIA
ncbi:MAG: hypothetical protein Q8M66_05830, partial [Actinomycetota bacterium]|nr:hypothetical protein [Actinomycetota bacterium]